MCLNENDKRLYAIKAINKRKLQRLLINSSTKPIKMLETEMAVLKKLNHPNVLQLYEIIDDSSINKLYLITEIA